MLRRQDVERPRSLGIVPATAGYLVLYGTAKRFQGEVIGILQSSLCRGAAQTALS